MVTVDTKLVGLLGYPLRQTFAPQMFNETLAYHGAQKLYILDIVAEASASLVHDINTKIRACAAYVPFENAPVEPLLQQSTVLVNASGLGMYPKPEATPVAKSLLYKELFVCDLTYNPSKTRLLLDAEDVGCKIMNGIGMAINQGIKGFTLLTGQPEPTEIMRDTMLRIIAHHP